MAEDNPSPVVNPSQDQITKPWRLADPKMHLDLLRCLQELDGLFTAAGIPYWICGGTLLGTVRHGGFIPHDDDVDLEVFAHDLERVRTLCATHPHLLFTNRTRYYDKQFGKVFFHGRKELVIDLFWREDPCPVENEFLGHEEIFPLRRYAFHDIEVAGPGHPEAYLRRCYGPDYLTHCRVWTHDWNKQFGPGFSKNREVLTMEEYNRLCALLGYRQVRLADHVGPGVGQVTTAAAAAAEVAEQRSASPRVADTTAAPHDLADDERLEGEHTS